MRSPRWEGRCAKCGSWGSLERVGSGVGAPACEEPTPLRELGAAEEPRRPTGIEELDRVLGGGAVPGATVLVGGEPGIGKSTLMLMVAARAASDALYIVGEESPAQVARRARRLGFGESELPVIGATDTEAIVTLLEQRRPKFAVIDSVQSMQCKKVEGAPGGPGQVRAAAERIVPAARASGAAVFLVGQVTKVGGLAGPRTLEHAVDAVLLFEGDRHMTIRALRAVKNRFGATDEIGLFEMREDGLAEVRDASSALLAGRGVPGPGAVIGVAVEGRRAICLEVQSLLVGDDRSGPRRRAQGIDARRLDVIAGCVETLFAADLGKRDIYVNVVGGLAVRDPGLDLAVAAAILGASWGQAVDPESVAIGEVGLRGEVRGVGLMTARLKEARAMGFERAFVPPGTPRLKGITTVEVGRVNEVFGLETEPRAPAGSSGSGSSGSGSPGS